MSARNRKFDGKRHFGAVDWPGGAPATGHYLSNVIVWATLDAAAAS